MSQSFTTDKLQQTLTFPFRDPDWKNKGLLASAIYLAGWIVPILPWLAIYGYGLRLMRRIIVDRREPHLPDWDNWGDLLIDGLKFAVVSFVYSLPAIVLVTVGYGLMFVPIFLADWESAEMSSAPLVGMFGAWALMGLGMLLALAASVFMTPAVAHMVATGELGAAFRVRQWWPIFRANLGGFLISLLILMGVYMGLSFVLQFVYMTIVLCCLIPFLMAPIGVYMLLLFNALIGEAYRAGCDNLAVADAVPAVAPGEVL